jgi:hypothetical protein
MGRKTRNRNITRAIEARPATPKLLEVQEFKGKYKGATINGIPILSTRKPPVRGISLIFSLEFSRAQFVRIYGSKLPLL